ncbi:MAG: hypothetical protein KDC61_01860 [Saprospiraceae bacterium]|nr:hypothetical protein [Saprospiraceae bacterium]
MKSFAISLLLSLLCCLGTRSSAQTDDASAPTYYNMYSYIKVAPGKHAEYLKLEKAWKKIHAARIKAGRMDSWCLMDVLSPSGAACEYNYVTRNTFKGDEQLAEFFEGTFMPDDWQSLLTKEELDLVNRTDEIRTLVKNEVWSTVDKTMAADMSNAKISVFNYFDFPEGKTSADHVKMEQDIWKPVHDARVKDGQLKGWLLLRLEFPFGADMPYHDATIDVYTDMKQLLAPWFEEIFAKVHAGKNIADLMKATREAARLVKGELRIDIDKLN